MNKKLSANFYQLAKILIVISGCLNCSTHTQKISHIKHIKSSCTPITDKMVQMAQDTQYDFLYNKLKNFRDNVQHVNINEIDAEWDNTTCLHQAILLDDETLVRALIERGADVNSVNRKFETPLHFAASQRNLKIVQLLVKKGINVNCQDINLNTPLHIAIALNHPQIASCLLRAGANPNIAFNQPYLPDRSLLHVAVSNGNRWMVSVLVMGGADPCVQDMCNHTPLDEASASIKELITKTLCFRVTENNGSKSFL
jgi:ankyrin repeat protein